MAFFGHGQLPADFWVYPLCSVHYGLSRFLMALIGLHICGALYRVIVRRDRLLRRMWFGRRWQKYAGPALPQRPQRSWWDYAPWISRAILVLPSVLFVLIGSKYFATPNQVAAGSEMTLNSPAAVTDLRVEGAVFFALAALTVMSLLHTRRLLAGLSPEVVLLTLSPAGILAELGRRRHLARVPRRDLGSPIPARSLHDGRGALDNGATIDAARYEAERAARLFAETR